MLHHACNPQILLHLLLLLLRNLVPTSCVGNYLVYVHETGGYVFLCIKKVLCVAPSSSLLDGHDHIEE